MKKSRKMKIKKAKTDQNDASMARLDPQRAIRVWNAGVPNLPSTWVKLVMIVETDTADHLG
jgi:hypothetical protein